MFSEQTDAKAICFIGWAVSYSEPCSVIFDFCWAAARQALFSFGVSLYLFWRILMVWAMVVLEEAATLDTNVNHQSTRVFYRLSLFQEAQCVTHLARSPKIQKIKTLELKKNHSVKHKITNN